MNISFKTFEEASTWARGATGRTFSPNSNGSGFVGKDKKAKPSSDRSHLDPALLEKQFNKIFWEFLTAVDCLKVGQANRQKILRYLAPLKAEQLAMLRAVMELQLKSELELHEAGISTGTRHYTCIRDKTLIVDLINEKLAATRVLNLNRQNKKHNFRDSAKPLRDLYSSVSNEDGEKAYLSDGVWILPDGTMTDDGR